MYDGDGDDGIGLLLLPMMAMAVSISNLSDLMWPSRHHDYRKGSTVSWQQ